MGRAEVSGHGRTLPRNKKIRVAAWVQVTPNVPAVQNTTIFQVHQWFGDCHCGPPLMMSFDKQGRLRARILRESHKHNKFVLTGWTRKSFEGRWVQIAVDIVNKVGKSEIEIFVAGQSVLKERTLIQKGGALYFKAGIYREGQTQRQLPTERVFMRNPTFSVLN